MVGSREVTWSNFQRSPWMGGARVGVGSQCSTPGERQWWLGWWCWREGEKDDFKVHFGNTALWGWSGYLEWRKGVNNDILVFGLEAWSRSRLRGKDQVPFWCKFEVSFTLRSGNKDQANGQRNLLLSRGASGLEVQICVLTFRWVILPWSSHSWWIINIHFVDKLFFNGLTPWCFFFFHG